VVPPSPAFLPSLRPPMDDPTFFISPFSLYTQSYTHMHSRIHSRIHRPVQFIGPLANIGALDRYIGACSAALLSGR
jgi:hypothetical protein